LTLAVGFVEVKAWVRVRVRVRLAVYLVSGLVVVAP